MTNQELQTIKAQVEEVFQCINRRTGAQRISDEDLPRLRQAFEFAHNAHLMQRRKNGLPYIVHPIAVARIVAVEMQMDANTIIAAFLHDVVEDTNYTIKDIEEVFSSDVAFLVNVVTKNTTGKHTFTRQVDNFKHMLNSAQRDFRPLLLKLADRLHNMRTLDSMPAHKQMKIAGETDFFYAPLANRLGLYNIKVELENLSMHYRCPQEYEQLEQLIAEDRLTNGEQAADFARMLGDTLAKNGITTQVSVEYRKPYNLWRKMNKEQQMSGFKHLPHRRFVSIVYDSAGDKTAEKAAALQIYSLLTDNFDERPGSMVNYIDSPKENGYQSLHLQLRSPHGECWEDVYVSSKRMVHHSQVGIADGTHDPNNESLHLWVEKFIKVVNELGTNPDGQHFMESIKLTFYNDDITVFSPRGMELKLPKGACAIDYAFAIHTDIGRQAHHAFINGQLASVTTELHRGDIVEIKTRDDATPCREWLAHAHTYRARSYISRYLASQPRHPHTRCPQCTPIPGEEVVGFKQADGTVTVHKRNCTKAISLATQYGHTITEVVFDEMPGVFYPVGVHIVAADRCHLLSDMVNCLSRELNLSIPQFTITSESGIVSCDVEFPVASLDKLTNIIAQLKAIDSVDEVTRVK